MYSGFSKGDGAVIGPVTSEENQIDFEETSASSGGEEAIVFVEEGEDGEASLAVAAARVNPVSGALLWSKVDYEAAMMRTISMSQMSSMLNDYDRNSIYMQAIKLCIDNYTKVTGGKIPAIVDIGSGTGLLSMAAAKYGARKLLACEMFTALAGVSESIIADNGFGDIVSVIPGKSSDLDLEGVPNDSPERPDIIISEILDSALLGESCMLSHSDAISRILSSAESEVVALRLADRVVPHSGEVFAHLIECPEISHMASVRSVNLQGATPWKFPGAEGCRGGWPLIPVHWQVYERRHGGKLLSGADQPAKVLSVEFHTLIDPTVGGGHSEHCSVPVTRSGVAHGVLLWWKVRLCSPEVDPEATCVLHTAPPSVFDALQAAGDGLLRSQLNWQDHWVQVVYPLPEPLVVAVGESVRINASHNCINIWLNVALETTDAANTAAAAETVFAAATKRARTAGSAGDAVGDEEGCVECEQESCMCGWHMLHGSERMQALSDERRSRPLAQMAGAAVDRAAERSTLTGKKQFVVDVSDGSILTLMGLRRLLARGESRGGDVALVSLETKMFSELFYRQLLSANARDGDDVRVWNSTADFTCIEEWVPTTSDDEDGMEQEEQDLASFAAAHPECRLAGLLSECYYYQMSIQPTWSALSFYYKRVELDPLVVSKSAAAAAGGSAMATVISPHRGRIMVAAVDCERLYRCHGPVGIVNGVFDHKTYDSVVQNWHEHCYPYKLGHYDKTMLSKPTCVGSLDYYRTKAELESSIIDSVVDVPITLSGSDASATCHFVAIWVDYQLTEDTSSTLELYRPDSSSSSSAVDMDFPVYSTVYIKFLPVPAKVTNASTLKAGIRFAHGDSDFKYDFSIV